MAACGALIHFHCVQPQCTYPHTTCQLQIVQCTYPHTTCPLQITSQNTCPKTLHATTFIHNIIQLYMSLITNSNPILPQTPVWNIAYMYWYLAIKELRNQPSNDKSESIELSSRKLCSWASSFCFIGVLHAV